MAYIQLSTAGLLDNSTGTQYSSPGSSSYERNPLNLFSSYNYVWTLSLVTPAQSRSRTFFHSNSRLDYIVLKSSGKGTKGIDLASAVLAGANVNFTEKAKNTETGEPYDKLVTTASDELSGILEEFNSSSSGRFDFFVDSVTMNGPLSIVEGATVPQLEMTVIEPLSITGFIESIRVNALAAGWENHRNAHFCLRLEFVGWPMYNADVPVKVPSSSRDFHLTLSSFNTTVDDRGSVHKLGFTSQNAAGYGRDGEVPTTVKTSGVTVNETLTSLMNTITEEWKKANGSDNPEVYNEYAVEFLAATTYPGDNNEKYDIPKGIGEYDINPDRLRSNQAFEFADPTATTQKGGYRHVQKVVVGEPDSAKETLTVKSGAKIFQVIESIVRESQYTAWFIDNKEKLKTYRNGLVPWFRVGVRLEVKDKINPKEQRSAYKFIYQVRPWWVHYSKLPEEFGKWDPSEIVRTLSRTYDYYYTGKNVDILSFNYSTDFLYFMDRPYRIGDSDRSGASMAAAPGNTAKLSIADQIEKDKNNVQNTPPAMAGTNADVPIYGSHKNVQISSYQAIAASIQAQLVRSNSMNSMEIKIIGDPYYLVTQGYGNSELNLKTEWQSLNGEAPWIDKAVYINVNFRNAFDYRPDGFMDFGNDKIEHYSGIFQVNYIISSFSQGQFTQTLQMTRLAGQQPHKVPASSVPLISKPKSGDQTTADTAPASVSKYGAKKAVADLNSILNPKIPSFGLAGLMNSVTGLFSKTSGALQSSVSRIDAAIADGLGVIQGVVAPLQAVNSAVMQIGGLVAVADALLNNPGAPAVGQSLTGYNPYTSGIPLQTTTLPAPSKTAQNQANQNAQANIISSFVQDTNNLYTLETNYKNNTITADGKNYITNPSEASNLSNVGQKTIAALNGIPTDPTALAAQLGIDPAQFSGLSKDQQTSLLSRLQKILASVPTDANIQGFQALGLSLKNVTGSAIKNLPALQALTKSPLANISQYDLQKILAGGGSAANLPGASSFASIGSLLALLGGSRGQANGVAGGNPLNVTQQLDKFNSAVGLNNSSLNTSNAPLASQGLGSVESNRSNAVRTIQGIGGYYIETNTVNSLYGTQRSLSPLDKLMITKTS